MFHVFRLYHYGWQISDALLTFLDAPTSGPRTIPLQVLSLSFKDSSHPIPADQIASEAMRYRLLYKTLQPLTVLCSFRVPMIDWSEQISLDDDKLAKLARSWPSLQALNLCCSRGEYPLSSTKYVTLQGLLSLVHACPKLRMATLPLDARWVPEIKPEEVAVCETDFAFLTVPEPPIDEPLPVAAFLFKYLPHLMEVEAMFRRPLGTNVSQIMAYGKAWQQVALQLDVWHYSLDDDDALGLDSEGSDN